MYKVNIQLLRQALRNLEQYAELLKTITPTEKDALKNKQRVKELKTVEKTIEALKQYHI
jgi:hypothetical protein